MMRSDSGKKRVNKLNLILSVIIAFAAWVYVVYNINPTMTRTYKDIPVKFTNESVLEKNDLAVKSTSFDTVDVTISAKRSVLDYIEDGDILANVDLADAGKGKNVIALSITVPNNATLKKQSQKKITVNVEDRETKTVEAVAVFDGNKDNDTEPLVTQQSTEEVKVSGAKSLISRVTSAKLTLDQTKVTGKEHTFSVKPVAVDSSGNVVKFMKVKPGRVSVTAVNSTTKKVKLIANVSNPTDDNYTRTYDAPSSIMIKGLSKDLKGITSIETNTIDISGITSSQDVAMSYVLPNGIKIANASLGLKLSVKVKGVTREKTFILSSSNVSVSNVASGLNATVNTSSMTVTATGDSTVIDALSSSDFKVTVNASGLDAGTYSLKPALSYSSKLSSASLSAAAVSITLN